MRKVLLVDDEEIIRKGLRAIIERSNTDFKDIYESDNGKDALSIITIKNIDLVILDIQMPNMDGITFMKELQKLKYRPKVIVLSGYDEFHYAKESLKYGAKEYLLKPVRRNELVDSLNSVEKEIVQEESINFNKVKVDTLINRFRNNELNYIILSENLSEVDIKNTLEMIDPNLLNKELYVALLFRHGGFMYSQSVGLKSDDISVKINTDFYFQNVKGISLRFFDMQNNMVIISDNNDYYLGLIDYLKQKCGGEYVIAISDICKSVAEIRHAYICTQEALKYRIIRVNSKIIYYSEVSKLRNDLPIPLELIKKLFQLLGTTRIKELEEQLCAIFNIDTINSCQIGYLEKIVETINTYINKDFIDNTEDTSHTLEKRYEYLKNIFNFKDINDYFYNLRNYLLEINDFLLVLHEECKGKNEVQEAMKFIEKNYAKDLDMAVVANHVSLNYTYFSYLFKEHTGVSFVDFLKKLRIDKAVELINSTDLKIIEVSDKVGFKSSKHFSKSFRAIVGISPIEYKRKLIR